MKNINDHFFNNLNYFNVQNTNDIICEFEETLGINFQKEYKKIMLKSNGSFGNIGKKYIEFWSLEDIEDFWEEIGEDFLEGLIPFASDGCGMAYAFKRDSNEIRMIPMDSLDLKSSKKCAENFDDFIMRLYNNMINEY